MTLAQLLVGKEGVIETVGGEGNLRCRFKSGFPPL